MISATCISGKMVAWFTIGFTILQYWDNHHIYPCNSWGLPIQAAHLQAAGSVWAALRGIAPRWPAFFLGRSWWQSKKLWAWGLSYDNLGYFWGNAPSQFVDGYSL